VDVEKKEFHRGSWHKKVDEKLPELASKTHIKPCYVQRSFEKQQ